MSQSTRETLPLKPLTQRELDERIGQVAAELFADESQTLDIALSSAPVPIHAADFVRRMRPFIVYN